MLYFGQLVIGPAGSGKSTYCKVLQQFAQIHKRNILVFNLDPAAQDYKYRCDIDIRDLITVQDVMEEIKLGPNGALMYAYQYILQNLDWIQQQLNEVGKDDYVLFDCPGQIQLYSYSPSFQQLVKYLKNYGFSLCSVYLLDVAFVADKTKYISGLLQAIAGFISLQLPALTLLSKCDLLPNKDLVQHYIQEADHVLRLVQKKQNMNDKQKLAIALCNIIDHNNQISIRALNISDEQSLQVLTEEIDYMIQYNQNIEPNDKLYQKAQQALNYDFDLE